MNIVSCKGTNEGAYVSWDSLSGYDSYAVYYKLSSSSSYSSVDKELISDNCAYILGLKEGTYDIKVVPISGNNENSYAQTISKSISVTSYDRSGYAHFKATSGVGAYNNDGTLKDKAVVVYVDNDNKNTVTCKLGSKTYTGLVNILQAYNTNSKNISTPLDIRIKGTISTNQFAAPSKTFKGNSASDCPFSDPTYYENTLETKYATNLKNLKCKLYGSSAAKTYYQKTVASCPDYVFDYSVKTDAKDTDSYFNMLDVTSASNVTVEGIGTDATIEQWGFTWSKCNSIEVRNLTFENYTEDACSFQGGSNSDMNYSGFWLHNCTFNRGLNNWDLTYEQDKKDGDGGFDLKYLKNVTSSNNIFYNTHKTGLIGGSDSAYTMNVTFHHNYYKQCSSRLPLGRQANMHFYNNYYDNCDTCQDIRAKAYCFSESNYFYKCSYPQKISSNAVIKSFNDVLDTCSHSSSATVVTDRTKELTNSCKPDGSTDYSSFTTDSSLFYYDSVNKKSSVTLLQTPSEARTYVLANAGVMKL